MIIIETIKTKATAWCEDNKKQAEEFWEIEKLIKAWAFFNRRMKSG